MSTLQVTPVLHGMSAEQYFAGFGLSQSGMKDLAVSPLRYWYLHVNPERPEQEPTAAQKFGTALHTLVLEGDAAFYDRYAPMLREEDYPGCLTTMEDLRGWLRERKLTPKGTRKAEVIQQVQDVDISVQIWDVLKSQHQSATDGKALLSPDDWQRIQGCANALKNEPQIQKILSKGSPEVSLSHIDEDTGTPLKARLDWVSDEYILDLKTFTQGRGKSIDQSVADAIFYECYYRQAYFYKTLYRKLLTGKNPKFVMAFVESDPPHEVRIKELRQSNQGSVNVWWSRAELETRHFKRIWASCMERFGTQPWRIEQNIEELLDEEMKGLAYS